MAEIKKFWTVADIKVDGSFDYLFTDPAITSEDVRIAQLMAGYGEGGISIHALVRIYDGTGQDRWVKEKTRIYDNEPEAKKDAEAVIKKARAKFEKAKKAAEDPMAARVASRFAKMLAGE